MTGEIQQAKVSAQRALTRLAATLLRVIAGSEYAVYKLRHRVDDYIGARQALIASRGDELTPNEEREALELPRRDDGSRDPHDLMFKAGTSMIIQGALRLAAHQMLDERPHFGGKYSTELISLGIKFREPIPPKPSQSPSESRTRRNWGEPRSSVPRKRRSSRGAPAKQPLAGSDPDEQ